MNIIYSYMAPDESLRGELMYQTRARGARHRKELTAELALRIL